MKWLFKGSLTDCCIDSMVVINTFCHGFLTACVYFVLSDEWALTCMLSGGGKKKSNRHWERNISYALLKCNFLDGRKTRLKHPLVATAWGISQGNTPGKLQWEALRASGVITNRFMGSSIPKNAFPQFSKCMALSELGKYPWAEEKLSPSKYRKCLVNKKWHHHRNT